MLQKTLLLALATFYSITAVSIVMPNKIQDDAGQIFSHSISPTGKMINQKRRHEERVGQAWGDRQEFMRRAKSDAASEAEEIIGPPIALVAESVPTYVPVPGAVPLPAAAAPVAMPGAAPQPAIALPNTMPQGVAMLPPAPAQQSAFAAPAMAAMPVPAVPALSNTPEVGFPTASAVINAPSPAPAKDAVETTQKPVAAIPAAASVKVTGVAANGGELPAKGNSTNIAKVPSADAGNQDVIVLAPQTKTSALNVLLFGLSVTIALFSTGFLACFLQGQRQEKEKPLQASLAAARKTSSPNSRGAPVHERDILNSSAPPEPSSRGRLASPENQNIDSCW